MRTAHRLDRWLLPAASARRLAVIRIAVGLYGMGWLCLSLGELLALTRVDPGRYQPVGVVAVLGIGPVSASALTACWIITLGAAAAVVAGRRHEVTGPVFAGGLLLLTTYQNSWGKLLHTENLLVVHALVLAVSPAADALVAGRRRTEGRSVRYGWALRAMALATVLSYVAAGVAKLRHGGLAWMTAENLQNWVAYDLVRKELFGDPYLSAVVGWLDHAWPFAVAAVAAVAIELAAPLALFRRRWARIWVLAAWTMHVGILVVMAVGFPYQLFGVAFLALVGGPDSGARDERHGRRSRRSADPATIALVQPDRG